MINLTQFMSTDYERRMTEVKKQLLNVQELLAKHNAKSGSDKRWGHVADLQKVNVLLDKVEATLS